METLPMNNKEYISVKEIQQNLKVSAPTAYKIIAQLNNQIKKRDPDTIIFPGHVQRDYYYRCINQCK